MKRKVKKVLHDMREKNFEVMTQKKTKKKKILRKRNREQSKRIGEKGKN